MAAAGRGRTAIKEAGVLARYRGTCVHDGWPAYSFYTLCRHALCGAHLLRELTFFAELSEETKAWVAPLKELLLEMKAEVERVSGKGGRQVAAERLVELTGSYERLIAEGLEAEPPPQVPEPVRRQARNLLLRLERRKGRCCCS
jgi:transposase